MKAVILAGGFGNRMAHLTQKGQAIPKPLLPIHSKSILEHIIDNYVKHEICDFIICGGYQFNKIKDYFDALKAEGHYRNVTINVVDTGLHTMTGGRVKRIEKLLGNDSSFLLTYGDALSNVDIKKSIEIFTRGDSLLTMTLKKHLSRFGEVLIEKGKITSFFEKKDILINIGFFVVQKSVLSLIEGDHAVWEKDVIPKILPRTSYYIHDGFWETMDTEKEYYEQCKAYDQFYESTLRS